MIETIKMVAYRAETAMAQTLKEKMSRQDDARTLLRSIFSTEADLLPDENKKTVVVRLHNMGSRIHDAAVMHLCDELNARKRSTPVQISVYFTNWYQRGIHEIRSSEVW